MSNTLSLTYTGQQVPKDAYWLRLNQEGVRNDMATVAQAAAVLDALFDIDPCTDSEPMVSKTQIELGTEADAIAEMLSEAAVEAGVETAICDQEDDGSVTVEIQVITSHPFDPHLIRVSGGELLSETLVQEERAVTITVDGKSSRVLDFPVVSGFSVSWQYVYGSRLPEIRRNGNTLYWKGNISGALRITYQTAYTRAAIKVFGVDGSQGEATFRCFFHGLVEEMGPELPEPAENDTSLCTSRVRWDVKDDADSVTCYRTVSVSKKCSCSKMEVDSYSFEEVVPCPEWAPRKCPNGLESCLHNLGTVAVTDYVVCQNDTDEIADQDYFAMICCGSRSISPPRCREEKRTWKGGAKLENGLAYWLDAYGNNLRVVSVSPRGGVCGEWTITQDIVPERGGPPQIIDGDYIVAPSSTILIEAENDTVFGEWTSDTLLLLSSSPTWALFRAPADFCGSANVTLTDRCGQSDSTMVMSTEGAWEVAEFGTEWDQCNCPAGNGAGIITGYSGAGFFPDQWEVQHGRYRCVNAQTHLGVWQASCAGSPPCVEIMWPGIFEQYCSDYQVVYGYAPGDTEGQCCRIDLGGYLYVVIYQYVQNSYKWVCSI